MTQVAAAAPNATEDTTPPVVNPTFTTIFGANYSAFPGIAQMRDGRLISVCRVGSSHVGTAGSIWVSYSSDLGVTWTSPVVLFDQANFSNLDLRDPAIAVLSDGRVAITYFQSTTGGVHRLHSCWIAWSSDNAGSWTQEQITADTFDTWCSCSAPLVETSAGTLLLPVYGVNAAYTGGAQENRVIRKTSGGSWTEVTGFFATDGTSLVYNEPNIVQCADGSLLAASRESAALRLSFRRSRDDGATWSATDAPTSGFYSGMGRPHMLKLSSGRILLFTRRTGDQSAILYYSDSNGSVFRPGFGLASVHGINYDTPIYMYAQAIELKPGLVRVAFGRENSGTSSVIFTTTIATRADPPSNTWKPSGITFSGT